MCKACKNRQLFVSLIDVKKCHDLLTVDLLAAPDKRFTVDLAPLTSEEEAVEVRGLYAILKQNPSLMDRRLQVGSEKPQIPSEHTLEVGLQWVFFSGVLFMKRS